MNSNSTYGMKDRVNVFCVKATILPGHCDIINIEYMDTRTRPVRIITVWPRYYLKITTKIKLALDSN